MAEKQDLSALLLPLAIGGGILLLMRGSGSRNQAAPVGTPPSPPPVSEPSGPTPGPVPAPVVPPINRDGYASDGGAVLGSPQMQGQLLSTQDNEVGQAAPSADRVKRLRNDMTFRNTYAFQSLARSMFITNELPDGFDGPRTQAMVREVQRLARRTLTPSTVLRVTAQLAKQRLDRREIPAVDLRLNHEWLPYDVVMLMNNAIISPFNRDLYAPIQSFYERGFPYTGIG